MTFCFWLGGNNADSRKDREIGTGDLSLISV